MDGPEIFFARVRGARLRAVSAVVPGNAVDVREEMLAQGADVEKAARFSDVSGLAVRRVAPEGVTASDLCAVAAGRLLDAMDIDRESVDALLFVTHCPDFPLPASAALLQHRLGLSRKCLAVDQNAGCVGWLNGLYVASAMVAAGTCNRVLLLVGDTPARFSDPANRVIAPVFGDAGTASLVEAASDGEMSFAMATEGAKFDALAIPGGGARVPRRIDDAPDGPFDRIVRDSKDTPWTLDGQCRIWMDGMAIYSFAVSAVPRHVAAHLAHDGLAPADVGRCFLHQANRIMVEAVARKAGFRPEQVPQEVLAAYGNQGGSSIPVQLCAHEWTIRRPVLLCSFGAGLAVASCTLSMEGARFLPVHEDATPADPADRERRIRYWHEKFRR
ncbi:MAG: ketoacyl-ACP synthase III [Desulfovibrio sp.]|jgi:3-oxoacyl-[acyl-carrier-protein] synthase-3|nr:ketoacyl-ACP synthase III [Desulfovibrio sp.]